MRSNESSASLPSRRDILRQAGSIGAACVLAGAGFNPAIEASTSAPAAATTRPVSVPTSTRVAGAAVPASLKSIVADIRARQVVADTSIHETLLRELIEEGVRGATGASSPAQAWNQLLRSEDII